MELNWTNFNEMSYNQLCDLDGIGKTVAKRIISMRPYRSNNDLFKVRGLGKGTLKKFGIKQEKKERLSWHLMEDGIEYPSYSLAINTYTNKMDFFWRIPKEKRQYL